MQYSIHSVSDSMCPISFCSWFAFLCIRYILLDLCSIILLFLFVHFFSAVLFFFLRIAQFISPTTIFLLLLLLLSSLLFVVFFLFIHIGSEVWYPILEWIIFFACVCTTLSLKRDIATIIPLTIICEKNSLLPPYMLFLSSYVFGYFFYAHFVSISINRNLYFMWFVVITSIVFKMQSLNRERKS